MRIKASAYFLVVFMLFSLLPVGVFAEQIEGKEKTVVFSIDKNVYQTGGKEVKTDVAPYIKDGRTIVPVAFVAPALGTEPVQWLPNDRMVMVKKGETRIYIKIDSKELLVNDQKIIMDVAAEIKDIGNGGGRTMLPISFIAKALDVGYEWKPHTRSVHFYGYNKIYNQAGSFGPDTGSEVIEGSITIKADGVKLRNMTVKGNLVIAEEVGKGTVTLENINVQGETFIRGGGKDSIHIIGGMYNNITIQNVDGQVRVTATGVDNLPVVIAEGTKGDEIILEGNFGSVKVEAEGAKISTQGQTVIAQLEIAKAAKETVINLNSMTTVTKAILGAKTEVKGTGIIKEAEVNADGIKFERAPEKQTVAANVTTQPTNSTTTTIIGGGGGGGGGSSSPTVENVGAITVRTTPVDVTGLAYDAGAVSVMLETPTSGAEIRYTTDGINPTSTSTLYTAPFTVTNPGGINGGTVVVKAIGIKSGMNNSVVTTKNVVYNAVTTATVTNVTEFQDAIANNNIGTITLGGDITGNVTGIRAGSNNFAINFGNYVLTGDLSITANNITALNLSGSVSPAVTGDMTVTAGNATVSNGLVVRGTITVADTGDDSWIEQVDDNTIIVTDDNGASIVIQGNPADITVFEGANGINITASSPVTITVNSGATVNSITAETEGTSITNNGTISNVTANADIAIENNSGDINVAGGGTVGASGTASASVAGTNVVQVEGISAVLGTDAQLRMGATPTANITGVVFNSGAGEYLNVTSANPAIVSVNASTGLAITAEARGRTIVTVRVLNDQDVLIKQGTIAITVLPTEITGASVTMVAPAASATPQTAAQVETATGNADYTVTSVTWNEALTANGKFKANQVYTATVVLTSKNNCAFQAAAFSPTVASAALVGTTTTLGSNVGNRVTFIVTFPATDPLTVTSIEVTTQPTKMTYTEGSDDVLNLAGMVITETYNDGSTGIITFADLTADDYTTDPANGANLTVTTNNGNSVAITHTASGKTANTGALTVNIPILTGSPAFSSGAPPTFGVPLVVGPGKTLNVTTNLTHAWYRSDNNTYEEGVDVSVSDPNGDTYIPVAADIGKYIIVVVTSADASGNAILTSGVPVAKASGPEAPSAPTLASKTSTTVVLNTITGAEYAKLDNGGVWKDSPEFTGLTPSTPYAFGARIKETAIHLASATSSALNVTTEVETNDFTEVMSKGTHYNITVAPASMIPADNQITANSTPITAEVTVGTFLGNLEFPYGASYKVANLASIPGAFETWNFDTITGKINGDLLAADDLLLVEASDGTTLRGYHITVSAPSPEALTVSAVTTGSDTVKLTFNKTITNLYNVDSVVIPVEVTVPSRGIELGGTDYFYYVTSLSGTPHIHLLNYDIGENWIEIAINGLPENYTAYIEDSNGDVVASDTFALDWTGLTVAEVSNMTSTESQVDFQVNEDPLGTSVRITDLMASDFKVFDPELFGISGAVPFYSGDYYHINPSSGTFSGGGWLRFSKAGYTPSYGMIMVAPSGYALTLEANPVAGGSVTDNTNTGPYDAGETVNLTATPNAGYEFAGWKNGESNVSAVATFDYTMPAADTTLTAYFQSLQPTSMNISLEPGSIIVNIDSILDNNGDPITLAQALSVYGLSWANSEVELFDGVNTFNVALNSDAFTMATGTNPATITINTDNSAFSSFNPSNFDGTEYADLTLTGTFAGSPWTINDQAVGMDNISVAIAKEVLESQDAQNVFDLISPGQNVLTTAQGIVDMQVNGVTVSINSSTAEGIVALGGTTTVPGTSSVVFGLSKESENGSTAGITVSVAGEAVATPTVTPDSGEVAAGTTALLATTTEGAGIFYTIDGTNPESDGSGNPTGTTLIFTAPITINDDTTIKAFAAKAGMINSSLATFDYTIGAGGGGGEQTAVPSSANIIVFNEANDGASYDSVMVFGLPHTGFIINIYDTEIGGIKLAETIPSDISMMYAPDTFAPLGYGANVIISGGLDTAGGTVWVSLVETGKIESNRTAKAYVPES